jgi:hypothetical protein
MSTEQFANNAQTTLNGGITAAATSLIVADPSNFPATPQFRILIDSELMLVTSVAGSTFTVTRGLENTAAAAHSNGATVTQVLTAGVMGAIVAVAGAPQAANTIFAGPASGGSAAATFRALVAADIPSLPASQITSGTLSAAQMPALTGDVTTSAGTVATTIAAGAVTTTKMASSARPLNNFLLNGGFDFAQRQTPGTATAIATDKYGPDRWRASSQSASLQYRRIDNSGSPATGTTARFYGTWTQITNSGKFLICQPLEGSVTAPLRSRTIVFQVKLKASSAKTIRLAILQLSTSGTIDAIPATLVTTWGGTARTRRSRPTSPPSARSSAPASRPVGRTSPSARPSRTATT